MKLNLLVLTPGKWEGKVIPINAAEFVIGRDPGCQLRPASPLISNRHCAVLVRKGKVYVRDFDSTNGTFVNDRQLKGEIELQGGDRLKVGPLAFEVRIEGRVGVDQPTPLPPTKAPAVNTDDEDAAALLLAPLDGGPEPGSAGVDAAGVPMGDTKMEILMPPPDAAAEAGKTDAAKGKPAKQASADTSSAAKSILEKYMRRPRTQ